MNTPSITTAKTARVTAQRHSGWIALPWDLIRCYTYKKMSQILIPTPATVTWVEPAALPCLWVLI